MRRNIEKKIVRKMLRINVEADVIKVFKMACIQLDMQEYEGMEEALINWTLMKQREKKIYLPKPERVTN